MNNALFGILAVGGGCLAFVALNAVASATSSPPPVAPRPSRVVQAPPAPSARPAVTAVALVELPPPPTPIPRAEPAYVDPKPLAAHVLGAMRTWAKEDKNAASFAAIAEDIAVVALSEPPAFEGDESRARTAILLASIALFEGSHYRRYVDEGRCNDIAWRATSEGKNQMLAGDCDGGAAATLWQIHADVGLVLYDDEREWVYASQDRGAFAYSQAAIIADRKKAARVALHLVRRSLRRGAGLCQYTGELGPCPKGHARLRVATSWAAKHPFPAER
jgi:hypothetical protein